MPLIITSGLGASGSGSGASIKTVSYLAYESKLVFTMDKNVKVDGPGALASSYVIEAILGGPVPKVQQVSTSGLTLIIVTEPHDPLQQYKMSFPAVGITSTVLDPYVGPFTFVYFPNAVAYASVQLVRTIDARLVEVVFDRSVYESDALNPANYEFTPSLTVKSVAKVTDLTYRLTTSRQVEGTGYTLVATGIRGK